MRSFAVFRLFGALALVVSFSAYPSVMLAQGVSPVASPVAGGVEVLANGLTNPRGFTWGDDGSLYLALAGTGGVEQVAIEATPAPFFVGDTGSIVTVADGCTTPVASNLPSLYWSEPGWTWGIMDLAILNGELYALNGGGHTPDAPNGIYRVLADGTWELVADLATWSAENPTSFLAPDDDPAGSWFDLEADGEKLWVSEAVRGQILTITTDGQIERVVDLSEGHLVPTGLVLDGEGGAYVTFETVVPFPQGGSKVTHVAADGTLTDVWTGLTAVTDLVMGPDGMLYAAEMASTTTDSPPYLTPGSGQIVRQTGPDSMEAVATDVPYPVYLGFDGARSLYLTAPAFGGGQAEGGGWLARIDPARAPVSLAGVSDMPPTCMMG